MPHRVTRYDRPVPVLCGPILTVALLVIAAFTSVLTGRSAAGATTPFSVGPVSTVSEPCTGQSAEAEQAVDPSDSGYVYEAWMGCQGIGFARSTNAGATFSPAITLPGSAGSPGDPTWPWPRTGSTTSSS